MFAMPRASPWVLMVAAEGRKRCRFELEGLAFQRREDDAWLQTGQWWIPYDELWAVRFRANQSVEDAEPAEHTFVWELYYRPEDGARDAPAGWVRTVELSAAAMHALAAPDGDFAEWWARMASKSVALRLAHDLAASGQGGPWPPGLALGQGAEPAAVDEVPAQGPCGVRVLTLAPISDADMQDVLQTLTGPFPQGEAISELDGQTVRKYDFGSLVPDVYMNDEIGNMYLRMIGKGAGRVLIMQTFFYAKLFHLGIYSHEAVWRWTKTIDLWKLDAFVVPINLNNAHWVLIIVNMREKRFEYFNSTGGNGLVERANIRRYMQDEYRAKHDGAELDLRGWSDVNWAQIGMIPQQDNGFDCGIFMCQYVRTFVLNIAINFGPANMPYMRQRMVAEILNVALMEDIETQ